MRTAIIIVCGFALWGACIAAARLLAGTGASAALSATLTFLVLWLLIAAGNLIIGVTRAGYSVAEEMPIFLLIFALPAAVAVVAHWKWLGASP